MLRMNFQITYFWKMMGLGIHKSPRKHTNKEGLRLGWKGEGEVRVSSGLWAEKNPVKCGGSGVREKVRRQLRVLAGDGDLSAPDAMLPGALTALPCFLSADLSGAAPGPRLEARSRSRSRTPRIKSISPRAPAKFHQVPGAHGKGVSWETWGTRPPRSP